ncbi:class I SAM-dependent methyltransferase [Pseudaestuariivita atlantica]|uniref:ATP synthase subunit beta n=1 Tax=Pseudaestuariivita atlantica TaxID=1317121 RepID=A0A0L1JT72_9RHOB|nr:SAM-dependent methyltransferase [Pseudaestuariivita atlantica]KNG94959.1 ATP synthase subunit beta [Pseudaestuariivita atlantica]
MTLRDRLIARIEADGPMTIAAYMTACLTDPEEGYYTTRDPLGRDFITAPEISQMFGELLGLALAQAWIDQGRPSRLLLAELGPGRGTLMADMRRAMAQVPGLSDAAEVHLVELSPTLRAEQAARVPDATWHDTIDTLPADAPLYLVANEFFDALPIRQFQRDPNGWREVQVGPDLRPGLAPAIPVAALDHRLADTRPGDLVEWNAPAVAVAGAVAARIAAQGGAALIVDYGDWRSVGNTFQAMSQGAPVDPFDAPGAADLTAHVDFEPLADAAKKAGLWHSRLTPQGLFLERLGITARAEALATRLTGQARAAHVAAHRRLTHPDEMGTLFKVLGIAPHPLPGFADDP